MTKVFTIATMPEELTRAWLQHLRDFDTANPGCHFEVMAEAPDEPLREVVAMLRVSPELSLMEVLEPRGVIVVVEAEHLCMAMRGVRKPGSKTVTSAVRGCFRSSDGTRAEAMSLLMARR